MSRFARLAVATTAGTVVLIGLGGFVRAMEAGLGCPDWPLCHGSPNPPSELAAGPLKLAWIEHSHRLYAVALIGLIVALAVAARRTGQPPHVRRASLLLVPAVLSQAVLGAVVVWARLDAETVTLHLAGALTVLGLSTYVTVHALGLRPTGEPALRSANPSVGRRLALLARCTAAATFAQMLLGSTVTGYDAGLAYGTFPSFNGRALPARPRVVQEWLHLGHRLLGYVLVALVVALVLLVRRSRAADSLVRRLTPVLGALVAVQVTLGAANIWSRLSGWTVVPHLVVGSLIWVTTLVVALRAGWHAALPVSARPERSAARAPVPA